LSYCKGLRLLRRPFFIIPRVQLCWLALLSAILLVAPGAARSAPAVAEAGSTASGDSIRAEIRGQLRPLAATAGASSGFQVSANAVAWELDVSGSQALLQTAQRLEGKPVIAIGTYAERRDSAGVRRVVVADKLQADVGKRRGEWIDVTVQGTLKARVFAIGAETTGVTITANGVTWELALHGQQLGTAGDLDGRKALVTGRLTRRDGVEIRNRFVVDVRSIKAASSPMRPGVPRE
jgi:hypothetical protein